MWSARGATGLIALRSIAPLHLQIAFLTHLLVFHAMVGAQWNEVQ
jgi:hypothetical protein